MEYKKNRILLGIIGLLLAVYFIGVQRAWFVQGNLPFVMLGGALLLLYMTKQKNGHYGLASLFLLYGAMSIFPRYLGWVVASLGCCYF